MAQRVPTELGEKPVGRLLLNYALPAIMAMIASSLYNIVDRAFIGHFVGKLALGGLTATFPFMNLGAAFGAMVGVGACTECIRKHHHTEYHSGHAFHHRVLDVP